ncbi:MAG TPA: DUF952 domain-containing protein [Candidatus Limnocylindrales bacterium]|nr:DUF952 domain-containing protein [Candidatus Limnocylindrales bacterium]
MRNPVAYHLVPAETWAAADPGAALRVASLDDEGFVHLTHRMSDLVDVANAFYRSDERSHVVLTIALRSLTSPWRYDGDDRYPHVYGPLDRAAIVEVRAISRSADGTFLPIERPDPRRRPDIPQLVGALVDGGVAFVVVGSAGATLLGADLQPGDLDVCVATDAANLDRLGAVLTALGARPRVWVPGWITAEEVAAWRPDRAAEALGLLFETEHGDLDIVFSSLAPDGRGEARYDDLLPSAIGVDVDGRTVAVASPSHLLASKLSARRPKDLRARDALERMIEAAGR